jgi:hypothetical protein
VEAWGEPTFRVRNKLFAMFADAVNHHGAGRPAVWCKAAPGNQDVMVKARPERFFGPPCVGPLAHLLRDAYRLVAPKRLLRVTDEA